MYCCATADLARVPLQQWEAAPAQLPHPAFSPSSAYTKQAWKLCCASALLASSPHAPVGSGSCTGAPRYHQAVTGLLPHKFVGQCTPSMQIPHLKELGINAVEILPVFEYDELEFQRSPNSRDHMVNIWGYSHINFFAPM